jgi:hypothetical protein
MSYFIKLNENDMVVSIMVATPEYFGTFIDSSAGEWLERSDSVGVGSLYLRELDSFTDPKTLDSWILKDDNKSWEAPTQAPLDGEVYVWSEPKLVWEQMTPEYVLEHLGRLL